MNRAIESIIIIFRFYFTSQFWKKSWKKILSKVFSILGAVWLIISLIDFFLHTANPVPKTPQIFFLILIFSGLISIITTIPPLKITNLIKGKDISITVIIGDMFNQTGDLVIPTNSTFDTIFDNDFISPKSIQGQFTLREFNKVEHLDNEINNALKNYPVVCNLDRHDSKSDRYEIGTIIKLSHQKGFYSYWIAIADVNEYGKPDGKFENLQICLEKLWNFVASKGHMTPLVLPILGSGRTGINESRSAIIKEIIFSFVAFANEQKITEELIICIHHSDITKSELDIYELETYLEYQCRYRYQELSNKSSSKAI